MPEILCSLFFNIYLFIWLCWALVAAHGIFIAACGIFLVATRGIFGCGMWDLAPDQGSNPDPLHWEHGALATGPPGKSPFLV